MLNNDIVADFFHQIDLDFNDDLTVQKAANPSIGGNLLFFKLCLNYLGINEGDKYYNVLARIAEKNKRYQSGFYLSDASVSALRSRFSIQNDYLQECFPNQVSYKFYSTKERFPDRERLIEDFKSILEHDAFDSIAPESKKTLLDLSFLNQLQDQLTQQKPVFFRRVLAFLRRFKR